MGLSARMLFCFILWEMFYSRRAAVFGNYLPTMPEWMRTKEKFPMPRHGQGDVPYSHYKVKRDLRRKGGEAKKSA